MRACGASCRPAEKFRIFPCTLGLLLPLLPRILLATSALKIANPTNRPGYIVNRVRVLFVLIFNNNPLAGAMTFSERKSALLP